MGLFQMSQGERLPASHQPTVLVFSDDWGRHPSSCQHLIGRLLASYDVAWVDTIGMRPPRLDGATFRRAWGKLRQWSRPRSEARPLPPRLSVLKPIMWPWFRRPWDRALNRRLLLRHLGRWRASIDGPVVAVTTLPITADLMGELPVDRWVYYCVDDFGQWPGVDQRAMEAMELEVIARADVLIAAGETLRQRLLQHRPEVHLLTHGVDLAHWRPAESDIVALDGSRLSDWEPPVVLFWGLIDRRMDVEFLRCLSAALPQGTIALVGPEADPDPALKRIDRVRLGGPVSFEQLPALTRRADVLVMPYADLPVTRAMQPLKMLEYLATGRPVIARSLPATRSWSDCLDLVETADEFTAAVLHRIREGVPEQQTAARQRLTRESWAAKAGEFERLAHLKPSKATAAAGVLSVSPQ